MQTKLQPPLFSKLEIRNFQGIFSCQLEKEILSHTKQNVKHRLNMHLLVKLVIGVNILCKTLHLDIFSADNFERFVLRKLIFIK